MSSTASGKLIAHPDISLVLRDTDLSKLPQVAAALAGSAESGPAATVAENNAGHSVLTAHADDRADSAGWCLSRCRWARRSRRFTAQAHAQPCSAVGRPRRRRARRDRSGPPHDRADPRVAGRRRRDRRRRARPPHRRSIPATSWKRSPASSTAWPPTCKKSYAELEDRVERPHRRIIRGPRPADRDRRGAGRHQLVARTSWRRCSTRCWTRRCACARPPSATARHSATASAFAASPRRARPPTLRGPVAHASARPTGYGLRQMR